MNRQAKAQARLDLMRRLRAEGHKQADIAKLLHVSPQTVSAATKDVVCPVNHQAAQIARMNAAYKAKMQNRNFRSRILALQMHGRGQTIEHIAKSLRKSPGTIREWILPAVADRLDRKLRRLGVPKADRAPIVEEVRLAA